MPKSADFLTQTALIIRERGEAYGTPRANMQAIADRWNMLLAGKTKVTAAMVCLMMIDLKMARCQHRMATDSVTDIAGYAACLAEILSNED
jgi:hypothetical protein